MSDQAAHPLQGLKDQYDNLCKQRDAIYEKAQPLEDDLTRVLSQINSLSERKQALVLKIDQVMGGQSFLDLKRHISALAKALGQSGGLLSK